MERRRFLEGAVALGGAVLTKPSIASSDGPVAKPAFAERPPLVPILARADRIVGLSVCTRPFRAAGPRIEVERMRGKMVVHNYGHGGSGWSLSWGSALAAVRMAEAARPGGSP